MNTVLWIVIVLLSMGLGTIKLFKIALNNPDKLKLSDEDKFQIDTILQVWYNADLATRFYLCLSFGGIIVSSVIEAIFGIKET